jgi:hypothetical protein
MIPDEVPMDKKAIFKTAWPYLQRFLTKRAVEYAADYLQTRREQRLLEYAEQETNETSSLQEAGDDSAIEILEAPPPTGFLSSDTFWFTLSGMLLGIALGVVAYILRRTD